MGNKTKSCVFLLLVCIVTALIGGVLDASASQDITGLAGAGALIAFIACLFAIFMGD